MSTARTLWMTALLLLPMSWAGAQNFDFHAPARASDPAAPEVMRDLAERILPVYQENNPERYLENLSVLQLTAGSYAAATETRRSLRERRLSTSTVRPNGRSVLYDIYTQARATEAASKVPFDQAFTQAFQDQLSRLSDQDAYAVTSWHGPPLSTLEAAVQSGFDQHRVQDSIPVADAVELIRAFLAFDATRSYGPLLGALDTEDDQRRYTAEQHVTIKTPRGNIAALLVLPKGADKALPALLEYTIYANSPNYAKECAAHGYAGVVAYVRETPGNPSYRVVPFQNDGDDVRAVIGWIAAQSWSDGRVGMYGGDYSGFTPWAAARRLPPALKAIATSSPIAPGVDFPMRGNIFRNSSYRWVYNVTNKKGWDDTYNDAHWHELEQTWYQSGKSYFEFDHTDDKPNLYFHRWLHHPSYDRFWQQLVPYREEFAHVGIPILTTVGYYGGDQPGALYYFMQHHRYNPQADHTLLLGPYDDGAMERAPQTILRGYQLDPVAYIDLRELRYQWFDSIFKGAAKPALLADRINYELMGANEWRHAASLDAMANAKLRFFLGAEPAADGHVLSQTKGSDTAFVRQSVSFTDRSDLVWAPPLKLLGTEPPIHNALKFISEPLPHAIDLSGLLSGRLDFIINKMDVDLSIALYELLPSGEYLALFDPAYTFRASYAHDRVHRHLLKDGERQQLAFNVERLASRRLESGSRLVVVLGVNKSAEQQINYGSGDDVSAESIDDGGTPLSVRWYGSSYIDLPVQQ
jgi:uncharacterized protein